MREREGERAKETKSHRLKWNVCNFKQNNDEQMFHTFVFVRFKLWCDERRRKNFSLLFILCANKRDAKWALKQNCLSFFSFYVFGEKWTRTTNLRIFLAFLFVGQTSLLLNPIIIAMNSNKIRNCLLFFSSSVGWEWSKWNEIFTIQNQNETCSVYALIHFHNE